MDGTQQLTDQCAGHERQVDLLIELYCDWRDASADVSRAYANYRCAPPPDRAIAWAAYGAALDREQVASETYALQVNRLGVLLRGRGSRLGGQTS
jgi:hypothetical protein